MAYTKRYKNLVLISLDHPSQGGYLYLIHEGSTSYTAFETFGGLSKWMAERGLNFSQEVAPSGTYQIQNLVGEFSECSHMSYDAFYSLQGHRTKQLSNGDWTLAIITADDTGHRVVNYLNPNCKDRFVYDYLTTRREMK